MSKCCNVNVMEGTIKRPNGGIHYTATLNYSDYYQEPKQYNCLNPK